MSAVATGAGGPSDRQHGIRIAVIWAVATVIMVPIVIWVIGPHIPPTGHLSVQSSDQHNVNVTLSALATPVALFVWVFFGYALAVFRQPRGEAALVDGPPIEGNPRIQVIWLSLTTAIVLGLAIFGTIDLFSATAAGAGGGQGPNPLSKPPAGSRPLQVQVIGQQWLWTFRYPAYGGVETPELVLPANRWVQLNVTSLDVAHSFWAYALGVKADAIPGTNNVAFVKPTKVHSFEIRCAELCGLWHGHMTAAGQVMSPVGFAAWIALQERIFSGTTKQLPPLAPYYFPVPLRRAS